jgi:hypothetical protein
VFSAILSLTVTTDFYSNIYLEALSAGFDLGFLNFYNLLEIEGTH